MFEVKLCTPRVVVGAFQVKNLEVPGEKGNLGIGPNHAPFVTKMKPGILSFEMSEGAKKSFYVSGGFLQLSKNKAEVLVEIVETVEQIDKSRAEKALVRAQDRLKQHGTEVDIPRALASLERARKRLEFLARSREMH